jgi:hypothetical protein
MGALDVSGGDAAQNNNDNGTANGNGAPPADDAPEQASDDGDAEDDQAQDDDEDDDDPPPRRYPLRPGPGVTEEMQLEVVLMDPPPAPRPGMRYRFTARFRDGTYAFYPTDDRILALDEATTYYYNGVEHRVKSVCIRARSERGAALFADGWIAGKSGSCAAAFRSYNTNWLAALGLSVAVDAMMEYGVHTDPDAVEMLTTLELPVPPPEPERQ